MSETTEPKIAEIAGTLEPISAQVTAALIPAAPAEPTAEMTEYIARIAKVSRAARTALDIKTTAVAVVDCGALDDSTSSTTGPNAPGLNLGQSSVVIAELRAIEKQARRASREASVVANIVNDLLSRLDPSAADPVKCTDERA
jgi:hypothetical protein